MHSFMCNSPSKLFQQKKEIIKQTSLIYYEYGGKNQQHMEIRNATKSSAKTYFTSYLDRFGFHQSLWPFSACVLFFRFIIVLSQWRVPPLPPRRSFLSHFSFRQIGTHGVQVIYEWHLNRYFGARSIAFGPFVQFCDHRRGLRERLL